MPVSLDKVIRALDQADTRVGNKADVKDLDGVNNEGSNRVGMTMWPYSKGKVIGEVESKIDTKKFLQIRFAYFQQ